MASTAFLPEGAYFAIGDGAIPTEAFVNTANVKSVTISGGEAEEIDVTTIDSVGRFKEFIAGFKDPGQVELSIFFNPDEASHLGGDAAVHDLYISGKEFNWKLVFDTPLGQTCTVSGKAWIKSEPTISIAPGQASEGNVVLRRRGITSIDLA